MVHNPPTGFVNSDVKMSPRGSPAKISVHKKQTEELQTDGILKQTKRLDLNLLMLEDKPIV